MAKRKKARITYPHFRRYNYVEGGKTIRAKHPKLIVERKGKTYGFMGLTESTKRGHHANIKLDKNPERGQTGPSYVRKELRYDDVGHFGDVLEDYRLSSTDKKRVLEFVAILKAKKKK